MLSEKEEIRLAERFQNEGDVEAARKLVLSHLRLVMSIARGYLGYGLPHADLIQEGNIGLMKAVKRFDPDRGVRLVSFAMHWIKAEIHEYILKNWRLVKVATTKAQRKLFFNLRSLKNDYEANTLSGRKAAEVAAQPGRQARRSASRWKPACPAAIWRSKATRMTTRSLRAHRLPGRLPLRADPRAGTQRACAHLQNEGLHDRAGQSSTSAAAASSKRRWLTEGEAATLHELAAEYGVSAERIRQIEVKAMQKMRGQLPNWPDRHPSHKTGEPSGSPFSWRQAGSGTRSFGSMPGC